MSRLAKFYPLFAWTLLLPLATSALAHNIKVSGNVAATFHIEPNHNPKSGEPSQTWFALTHKGGTVIPLAQCDCTLAVHAEPHKQGEAPLLKPVLKSLSIEQYQGIPSAEITFPNPGEYELEISGKPKAGAKFQPFELSYTVTVLTGSSSSLQPSAHHNNHVAQKNQTADTTQKASSFFPTIPIAITCGIVALVALWALRYLRQSR
jgi:hypothetical protein